MADDASLAQLAGRLRKLRADTGFTLRELSRKVHVSDSSLSRYFAGQALPSWEVVQALADLAGADQGELRQHWESATQARKRARYPEPHDEVGEPQVPLWEPEQTAEVPPVPVGTGRRVALVAGVVVLVAVAGAAGWLLHGDDHIAVPLPQRGAPDRIVVPTTPPGTASAHGTTSAPAPSPGPTTGNQPARLPPARTPSGTDSLTRVRPGPVSPSRNPAPSATSRSPSLLSGEVVALTNNDSGTGSVPYVIDVADWSMDDDARLHLWYRRTDGDYRNQLWTAEKVTAKNWRFVNVYSGKCLYREAGGSVSQTGCASDPTQQWAFGLDGEVSSAVNGACVEIEGHQRLTDAGLQTATCDGRWYQLWHAEQRPLS